MNNISLKLGTNIINKNSSFGMVKALLFLPSRNYPKATSFPEYYQNPIFRKEDQAKLIEDNELSLKAQLPVKPPASYETSSVYHDPLVNKVINHVMEMGKKQLARSLVEKAFENIKRKQIERYHLAQTPEEKSKIELDPKVILYKAIENSKPLLMLTPIKRGGISYQVLELAQDRSVWQSLGEAFVRPQFIAPYTSVPGPVTDRRSLFLAIKWLLEATNEKERTVHFPEQFAWELIEASNNTGKVIKRKQDLHRQCEANRAYAHYRWQ